MGQVVDYNTKRRHERANVSGPRNISVEYRMIDLAAQVEPVSTANSEATPQDCPQQQQVEIEERIFKMTMQGDLGVEFTQPSPPPPSITNRPPSSHTSPELLQEIALLVEAMASKCSVHTTDTVFNTGVSSF